MNQDNIPNAYAHYGIRTPEYKLIYWYNEAWMNPVPTPEPISQSGNSSISIKIHWNWSTSTTTPNTPRSSKT